MRLEDLLRDVEIIETAADIGMEIKNVRYDSRKVSAGDAFVAIKGFESDGHDYIQEALDSGARVIICTEQQEDTVPYILVRNSRLALALVSGNFFGKPASRMKLIGVTGTNGKTTTATLIKHVLEEVGVAKVGLIGSNKNMIGGMELDIERTTPTTPESYDLQKLLSKMADEGCEYVVMEVSSHALVLDRVAGIEFEIGVFTNLTQDHLDFHVTMEDYARAKGILFQRCKRGCVNLDDAYADYIIDGASCEIFTYSTEKNEAYFVAKDIRLEPDRVKFCAVSTGVIERVALNIPGLFSIYNALAAMAVCVCLGLSSADIATALGNAKGVRGRMEIVPTGRDYTILIDYAHTPDALENVLTAMKEVSGGRVVALFGCGGDRDRTKRPIMGEIAARCADIVIVTSDNPRTEEPEAIISEILSGMADTKTPYVVIEDRRKAITYAIDNAKPGDVIILAGKGHETYQIVGKTKTPMDERAIVMEHLAGGK